MANSKQSLSLSLVPLGRERLADLAREAFNALVRWELSSLRAPLRSKPDDIDAQVLADLRLDTRALCDRLIAAGVVDGAVIEGAAPVAEMPAEETARLTRRAAVPADMDTSNSCNVTLLEKGPAGRSGPWVSFATMRPGLLSEPPVVNHLRPEQAINLAAWLFSVASASWAHRENFRTLPSDIFSRTLEEISR
jgi:hypothetical protein